MKMLGIDTSTNFLSLAVTDKDKLLAGFHENQSMKHASLLIPTIDSLLKKCKLRLKDINAIALSIGPGSFTGLRIGVATCKGINLALGIPIIAVPTLDAIAYNFIDNKKPILCPLIDAKKQKVYACFYEAHELKRLSDYMLIDIDTLLEKINRPTLLFGDGIKLYGDYCKRNSFVRISVGDWHPRAEVVARMGLAKAKKRRFDNPDKLVPMYLYSRYCQVKGHKE